MSETTFPIKVTDAAADKAYEILSREGREDLRLRVQVKPGGCSGLIYALYFDDQLFDADLIEEFRGIEVVVDKASSPYIEGSTVDFSDTLEKQGFQINNPNAEGTCACGDSFH